MVAWKRSGCVPCSEDTPRLGGKCLWNCLKFTWPGPWLLLLPSLARPTTLTFLKEFAASSQAQFVVPTTVTAAGLAALPVVLGHQVGEGSTTAATTKPCGALTLVQLQRPGSVFHTLPLLRDTAGLQAPGPRHPASHSHLSSPCPCLAWQMSYPCHLQGPAPLSSHIAGPAIASSKTDLAWQHLPA